MEITYSHGRTEISPDESLAPLSSKIRDFVWESRKSQTLYANCEGGVCRRKLRRNDLSSLEDYVRKAISNGQVLNVTGSPESENLEKIVSNVTSKILEKSRRFGTGDEVHFFILWLYFFEYDSEETKSTPVFKVFRKKEGSEALYFDTTLQEYNNWDNFVHECGIPSSFVCFPRGGEYIFRNDGGDKLDLEFFCNSSYSRALRGAAKKKWWFSKPWSQFSIRPWIGAAMQYAPEVYRGLKFFIHILIEQGIIPYNYGICITFGFAVMDTVAAVAMKKQEFLTRSDINSVVERVSYNLKDEKEFGNDHSHNPKSDSSNSLSKCDANLIKDPPFTFRYFLNLLKHPRKNWLEILKYISWAMLSKGDVIISVAACIYNAANTENWQLHLWNALNILFERVCRSWNTQSTEPYVNEEDRNVSKALSNLEMRSRAGIDRNLLEVQPWSLPRSNSDIVSSDTTFEFDVCQYKLYILRSFTVSQCMDFLRQRLHLEIKLVKNSFYHEIVLDEETKGFVVFLTQSFAVAALTTCKEIMNTRNYEYTK